MKKILILSLIPILGLVLMLVGGLIVYSKEENIGKISIPGELQFTISEVPAMLRISEVGLSDDIDRGFENLNLTIHDKLDNKIPVRLHKEKNFSPDEDEAEYNDIAFFADIKQTGSYLISTETKNTNLNSISLEIQSIRISDAKLAASIIFIGLLTLIIGSIILLIKIIKTITRSHQSDSEQSSDLSKIK